MLGSKLTRANQREGDGKGAGLDRETSGGGQGPFWLSGAVLVVRGRSKRTCLAVVLISLNKRFRSKAS